MAVISDAGPASLRRVALACWWLAFPIGFGLISLSSGQDANWDLRNYHLYNPWSLLTGRLGIDIAPAETPTYFNPLLDVPYFLLADRLSPPIVAFLFGAFHGLGILAVYRIGARVLTGTHRHATAAMLALFAGTDNAFTAELGNTMGDDTTAVLILSALAVAIGHATGTADATRAPSRVPWSLGVAGLLAGLGTGLKLTNAPYAVAVVVAACAMRGSWRSRRFRIATTALGVAVGIVVTYGYWGAALWTHFGNPFYPQFNGLFRSPLAGSTMVVDNRWGPSGWFEVLAYPIAFTLFPIRIFEIPLVNFLWPAAYALFIAAMLRRRTALDTAGDGARFLLVFVGVAFVAWMAVFSIGRYLIPLDLLLPLLVWLLLHRLFAERRARRLACAALLVSLVPLVFNFRNWGTADFAEAAFRVDPPAIDEPARATILVMTAPVAWMFPRFPPGVAYVSFGGTFPESPAHRERIAATIATRGGPVYALLGADEKADGGERSRLNKLFAAWDVRKGDVLCRYAVAMFAQSPGNDIVFDGPADSPDSMRCRIRSDPDKRKALFRDAPTIVGELARSGWSVELARCAIHRAWIGADPYDYRFCPVDRIAPATVTR